MATIDILSDTSCHLGEGPTFCGTRKTLFWFDIMGKVLHARHMLTGAHTQTDLPELTSALAVADDEHDVLFTETGLWLRHNQTGALEQICMIEADNPDTRSNDARVHPSGAFWLGTMGKSAQKGAGAYYHYRAGTLTKLFGDITIPNSTCFSPDGRMAYFTDSRKNVLMKMATDPDTGLPESEPVVFYDHSGGEGSLDGSIVDADGFLWNARWGAASLDRYDPTGQRVLSIAMPATQVTCPAFIGNGAIAVTSAYEGMDAATRAKDPQAGKTFLVKPDIGFTPAFDQRIVL